MTLPRLEAITERWKRIPPVSVTVAGIGVDLGMKLETRQNSKTTRIKDETSFADFMASMGAVGSFEGKTPEWAKEQQAKT